jgi:hypothetical protein
MVNDSSGKQEVKVKGRSAPASTSMAGTQTKPYAHTRGNDVTCTTLTHLSEVLHHRPYLVCQWPGGWSPPQARGVPPGQVSQAATQPQAVHLEL